MLSVTAIAGAYLAEFLDHEEQPEDMTLRLECRPTGEWSLRFDHRQSNDRTCEYEQRTILVCDTQIAQTVDGRTIDVLDTEVGPRLIMLY
jgi:Fe-S cluster assembly iron-binding protein IscA